MIENYQRKLAELATPKAVAELEKRKKNIEIEREVQEDLLLKNYVNASAQPGFKNMVPQDQMDLYTTSTTPVKPATPTKP